MADTIESMALEASRRLGQKQDPKTAATALDAERELGIPFEVAQRNIPQITEIRRQRAEVPSSKILETSPVLAQFLTNPTHAALTRDEIPQLMQLEQSLTDPEPGMFANVMRMMGNSTNQLTGDLIELVGKIGKRATNTTELMVNALAPGVDTGVADHLKRGFGMVQDVGTAVSEGEGYDYIPKYTLDRMLADPSVANIAGIIVEQGGGSIPHMLGMLASLPVYSATLAESMAQARATNNNKADSTLEDTAAMLPVSVAIAMLDKLSFTEATKLLKAGDILKGVGKSAVREGGTEIAQEELQYGAESIGTDEGFKPEVALERGLTAAIAGAGMGGTLTTGSAALSAVTARRQRNMTEELSSKFEQTALDEQLDVIKNLAFRQTSAPKFNEYLASVTDGKNLYLSPDVLTELEAAGIAVPFLDGKADGEQDIQISYTDIASVIEDDKVMKVLRPYLKRTAGSMSQAEQAEAQSARESVSVVEMNTLIENATRDQQVKSQADAIHAEIMKGIVATGRQGPATARYTAETITAYVTAKVDELQREKGVTLSPREVYAQFGLKVEKMTTPTPGGIQQVEPADLEVIQNLSADDLAARTDLGEVVAQAKQHNNKLTEDYVRENFTPEQFAEFQAKGRFGRDKWLDANLTGEQDNAMQATFLDENRLEQFSEFVGQFDPESPAAMGRSIALWFKKADSPDFKNTPEYAGIVSAMRYAEEQGWSMDEVIAPARGRIQQWAGRDAAELFPRFFQEPSGPKLSDIELEDEFEGDDGQPVTVTMSADKALEDIDTRMDNAKKLIACLRK